MITNRGSLLSCRRLPAYVYISPFLQSEICLPRFRIVGKTRCTERARKARGRRVSGAVLALIFLVLLFLSSLLSVLGESRYDRIEILDTMQISPQRDAITINCSRREQVGVGRCASRIRYCPLPAAVCRSLSTSAGRLLS